MKSDNLMQLMVTLGYGELIEQATINELWAEAVEDGCDGELEQEFINNIDLDYFNQ